MVDSLMVSTRQFKVPQSPMAKYDVEIKYRSSVPDNVKHWKVFKDDLEIERFLQSVDEFSALHIDQDPDTEDDPYPEVF